MTKKICGNSRAENWTRKEILPISEHICCSATSKTPWNFSEYVILQIVLVAHSAIISNVRLFEGKNVHAAVDFEFNTYRAQAAVTRVSVELL